METFKHDKRLFPVELETLEKNVMRDALLQILDSKSEGEELPIKILSDVKKHIFKCLNEEKGNEPIDQEQFRAEVN